MIENRKVINLLKSNNSITIILFCSCKMCQWAPSGKWSHITTLCVDTMGEWKLDLRVMKLLNVCAFTVSYFDRLDLNNLYTISLSSMAGSHITVCLSDSTCDCNVSVFTVPLRK